MNNDIQKTVRTSKIKAALTITAAGLAALLTNSCGEVRKAEAGKAPLVVEDPSLQIQDFEFAAQQRGKGPRMFLWKLNADGTDDAKGQVRVASDLADKLTNIDDTRPEREAAYDNAIKECGTQCEEDILNPDDPWAKFETAAMEISELNTAVRTKRAEIRAVPAADAGRANTLKGELATMSETLNTRIEALRSEISALNPKYEALFKVRLELLQMDSDSVQYVEHLTEVVDYYQVAPDVIILRPGSGTTPEIDIRRWNIVPTDLAEKGPYVFDYSTKTGEITNARYERRGGRFVFDVRVTEPLPPLGSGKTVTYQFDFSRTKYKDSPVKGKAYYSGGIKVLDATGKSIRRGIIKFAAPL